MTSPPLSSLARRLALYDLPSVPGQQPTGGTLNNNYLDQYGNYIGPSQTQQAPAPSVQYPYPIQLNPSATPASQLPSGTYGGGYSPSTPPDTFQAPANYMPGDLQSFAQSPPGTPQAAPDAGSNSDSLASILAAPQAPTADLSGVLAALQGGSVGMGGGGSSSDAFLSALISELGPAPQMPKMNIEQTARDQIQLQYGQQEAALRNAMQQLANSSAMQQQTQTQYGQNQDQSLQNIFNALRNDLYRTQGDVANTYGQTQNSVRGSYDEASDALGQLKNDVVGQLGGTADQLGIQQGMGSPLTRLLQSFATMQGGNLQNKATSLAGLSTDQANQLALGDRQIAGAASQGASARRDLASGVQNALAQLGLQTQTQQGGLQSQMTALEEQKPADYRTNVTNLGQMLYNMQRQSRLDQLGEMVQLGTLQQGQENIDLKSQQGQSSNALGFANLALQQQKLQQDYALATDPLKRAQLAQQIGLLQSQQDYYTSRAGYYDAGGAAGVNNKGTHGDLLEQYLDTAQPGLWDATGSGPQFRTGVLQIINDAGQQAKLLGGDPYAIALQQLGSVPGNLDQAGLRAALQRYFKGT